MIEYIVTVKTFNQWSKVRSKMSKNFLQYSNLKILKIEKKFCTTKKMGINKN